MTLRCWTAAVIVAALLGGGCAVPRESSDADGQLLSKNQAPFVPLRKKRRVDRGELPQDLVRFYVSNEGVGLKHDPDRMVRVALLDEVQRVVWEDLHLVSLFPPPSKAWSSFEAFRVGYSDTLDEIVYVLSAPGISRGSILVMGTGVTVGPPGTDANGPEGAIVVAGSWDEWIGRMRQHAHWGDSGIGSERGTRLSQRLAELNPHSDYAK